MRQRLLLVEDDEALRELVALALERAGMSTVPVGTGQEAIDHVASEHIDLVLLDVMLPGMDGFAVCRALRRTSQVPIIMMTARSETHDVIAGLECGADDYVKKPFEPAELLARIHAVLRRASTPEDDRVITVDGLRVNPAAFTVERDGTTIPLSATEFRLLLEFARNPHRVLTRETLLSRVWNYDYMGESRLVDMAVKRLRDKIDGERPIRLIATVRGVGYRFEPDDAP